MVNLQENQLPENDQGVNFMEDLSAPVFFNVFIWILASAAALRVSLLALEKISNREFSQPTKSTVTISLAPSVGITLSRLFPLNL